MAKLMEFERTDPYVKYEFKTPQLSKHINLYDYPKDDKYESGILLDLSINTKSDKSMKELLNEARVLLKEVLNELDDIENTYNSIKALAGGDSDKDE